MTRFTQEFVDFFKGLAHNNTRDWYHAHKAGYETHVKAPFNDFVAEVIHRVSAIDPEVAIEPKDAVFRLARDVRFSKDKTPYKPFASAVISRGGRKDMQHAALYFSFGNHGVAIGGGMYQPDRDNLVKIRRAIAGNGAALARALNGKAFQEVFGELLGEKNKRLPKEFEAAEAKFPFIANKQFYYFAEYDDPKIVLRDDLAAYVMRHYRAGRKVNEFLETAVQ